MSRFTKLLITGTLALAVIAPIASAQRIVFRGYYGAGFYGPAYGWYGPGWGPYGYASAPPAGSLKFEHTMKDTSVFVDGGFAGTVGELKTFKLHPGTHNIELRAPDGHPFYQQKVDIVPGKTLKITP
jgi:hypothetical protein